MGIFGLEQIANENDIVLLDTNVAGYSNTRPGNQWDTRLLTEKSMPELKEITFHMILTNQIISDKPNITTIKEVIEECDPVINGLYKIYANTFRSASPDAKTRCWEFNKLYSHLTGLVRTLRKRMVLPHPAVYHPIIAITLEVAHLMPLFSDTESHYEKSNPDIITDELLVANAFALALQNKGRIGVVSYDSRIPKLIRGNYTFLLSDELSSDSFDFWETLLKNPISFYGLKDGAKIKRGEFVSHYIMDDADEFPYQDVKTDEKLRALVEECRAGAEEFALRIA